MPKQVDLIISFMEATTSRLSNRWKTMTAPSENEADAQGIPGREQSTSPQSPNFNGQFAHQSFCHQRASKQSLSSHHQADGYR